MERTERMEQSFFVIETKVGPAESMHCRTRLLPGADTTFTVPCTHIESSYIVLRNRQTAKPTLVNHACLGTPWQKAVLIGSVVI